MTITAIPIGPLKMASSNIYKSCSSFSSIQSVRSSYFSSCVFCKRNFTNFSDSKKGVKVLRWGKSFTNMIKSCRLISNTATSCARRKIDYYKEEKLPIFDYGKIKPENKRIYVCGQAAHGGLGLDNLLIPREDHQKPMRYMHRPVRHWFGDKHTVIDIAAGHGFSLIAVKPKQLNNPVIFGTGYNQKSQLGYHIGDKGKPLQCLIAFVPIPLPLDKSSNVLSIAAGRGHSVISVAGKGLLALGDNSSGQCGRKIIEDEEYMNSKYVCRIPPFGSSPDYDIMQISSKFDANVCLSREGNVYTFGSNLHGQLGRGKKVDTPWIPKIVEGDLQGERIKKVITNGASVLAVTEKGELFGWGANDCGQLNPSEISTLYYNPTRITLPHKVGRIIDVAIGDLCTFVLNEFGNVYVWGSGYALGLGPKNVVVKTPTLIPPPLFGRNEFAPNVAVVKIGASSTYSVAINSNGDLFTWGENDNGCLGLGGLNSKYQFFPFKMALGGPAHKFALGADHNIIMTKAGY